MAQLSKTAQKLKEVLETGAFSKALHEISDEDYNGNILNCFSTDEMINALDERGELGEAYGAYAVHLSNKGVNPIREKWHEIKRDEKVKLLAEFLNIPHLSPGKDFATAIEKFINNR